MCETDLDSPTTRISCQITLKIMLYSKQLHTATRDFKMMCHGAKVQHKPHKYPDGISS